MKTHYNIKELIKDKRIKIVDADNADTGQYLQENLESIDWKSIKWESVFVFPDQPKKWSEAEIKEFENEFDVVYIKLIDIEWFDFGNYGVQKKQSDDVSIEFKKWKIFGVSEVLNNNYTIDIEKLQKLKKLLNDEIDVDIAHNDLKILYSNK